MRGQAGVRVVGIEGVRTILPDEGVREAFRFELLPKFAFVYCGHFATANYIRAVIE